MFNNCKKLNYVNLNNSYERNDLFVSSMFGSDPINMAICINNNNTKIFGSLSKLKCPIIDCSNDWKIHQKKVVYETQICVDNCSETENNTYEYENICYETCPIGTYPHKNFKCELTPETDLILSTTDDINIKSSNLDGTYFDNIKNNSIMNYNEKTIINTNANSYESEKIKTHININYISTNEYFSNEGISTNLNIETNLYTNMNYVNYSSKVINNYQSEYNIYSTEISYNNQNEYFYDISNFFPDNNNTEIFNQLQIYISKNYSIYKNQNIIIKG